MDLSTLNNLGLPGWFIVVAATVIILERVGILKFIYTRFIDKTEHEQQSEDKQAEHLQKSQSDALSSTLAMANRVVDSLIASNNGQILRVEERVSQAVGILRNIEGQQTITNRDWSRMEEVLSDIDLVMHEIKIGLEIKE